MYRKKRQSAPVTTRNRFPNLVQRLPVAEGRAKTSPEDENVHESTHDHVLCDSKITGIKTYICQASFVGVFKVLVLIIIVPPLLNYASLQRELTSLSRPGEMHDGPRGNKLLMSCSGKGSPVIVMDTPGGFSSDLWSFIAFEVAKFTKVCIYDRAGLGFSERALPRFYENERNTSLKSEYEQFQPTSENMVVDIHHLIKTVSHSSDVVLVGGGLGTINARFYARFYENVFGIVLINSFHEDMFDDEEWSTFWYDHFIPSLFAERISATLGLVRLGILTGLRQPSILVHGHFENDVAIRLKHLSCSSGHLSTGIMEHYYMNESLAQLKILQKLKSFPQGVHVSLISSRNFSNYLPASLNELWFTKQELFAKEMFIGSERTIVDSDFNSVYFNQPDVIVKAIKKLVMKFRKSIKQSAKM